MNQLSTQFCCHKCPKLYARKESLIHHLLEHRLHTVHTSVVCPESFRKASMAYKPDRGDRIKLPVQLDNSHQPSRTIQARRSGEQTMDILVKRKKEDINLISSSNTEEVFSCIMCNISHSSLQALKSHVSQNHKNKKSSDEAKQGKMEQVEKVEEFPCQFCPKTFKVEIGLRIHIIRMHKGQEQKKAKKKLSVVNVELSCSKCNKTFKNKHGLNIHHLRMHQNPEKLSPVTCKYCSKVCKGESGFKVHMYRIHKNQRDADLLFKNKKSSPSVTLPVSVPQKKVTTTSTTATTPVSSTQPSTSVPNSNNNNPTIVVSHELIISEPWAQHLATAFRDPMKIHSNPINSSNDLFSSMITRDTTWKSYSSASYTQDLGEVNMTETVAPVSPSVSMNMQFNPIYCPICQGEFYGVSYLISHLKNHQDEESSSNLSLDVPIMVPTELDMSASLSPLSSVSSSSAITIDDYDYD